MLLSEAIDNYLAQFSSGNVPVKTKQNYQHYLKRFLLFLGDIDSAKLNLEKIKKYQLFLFGLKLKKNSQNYFLIALRGFLKYLSEKNLCQLDYQQIKLYVKYPILKTMI